MQWNDIVNDVLPIVWPVLWSLALLVAGRYLVPSLKKWLDAKIDGEKHGYWEKVVLRATDAIYTAVKDIGQTYVDAIKEGAADGKLTDGEKKSAKKMAEARARELIGPAGIAVLAEVLGGAGVGKFIGSKIEAVVKDSKPDPS